MPSAPRHAAKRLVRSWPQRLGIAAGASLTAFCLLAASAVGYVYWKTGRFLRADVPLDQVAEGEPINYLIIGSDSRDSVDPNDPNAGAFLGEGEPTGKRSDTILIVRIDPTTLTAKMLSFPRDLYIPIAGETGRDRINSAYGRGRAVLVDTIRQDFGIEINNYIEVDFSGFKGLVGAIGGVPMYFDTPMRDENTGLDIEQAGCVSLDGDQALAFARARHLEFKDGKGRWQTDPTGDLGRITRQQIFVRKAMAKVLSLNPTDVLTFNHLLDVAVDSVTIDQSLGRGQLLNLVRQFKNLQPEDIESFSLPVTGFMTSGGASVLQLDERGAKPILNVFRGLDPSAVSESEVSVTVRNGTGLPGRAKDVKTALDAVGFTTGDTGNAATTPTTEIHYAPGSEFAADLLARHLTSPAALVADSTLGANDLRLIVGTDFTTVMQNPRAPVTTTTTAPPTTTTAPGVPQQPDTTTSGPTTTVVGITPGEAPPGVAC
jgi:LCP family protein required for cell wall assembly